MRASTYQLGILFFGLLGPMLPAAALCKVAVELPPFSESFALPGSLEAWQRLTGAKAGEGPESLASWDEGALKLEGTAQTRVWLTLQREAPLSVASWIRISVRMKTEDVRPEGARWVNCNVYVRFPGGPLLGLKVLTGTNPWTTVARRFRVPANTSAATVGLFLSLPGRAWFDDLKIEPVPEWVDVPIGPFRYRVLPGDDLPDAARAYNKQSYEMMVELFGPVLQEVVYYKYPDLDTIEEYTGRRGNAHIQDGAIHSIWPSDRHEIVHLFAKSWGDPPALLGEGLAVHLSGGWQGKSVKEAAAAVLGLGRWPTLAGLLDTRAFRALPDETTYPVCGAFAGWVLEKHGKEKLRQLYGELQNQKPAEENLLKLEAVLGQKLEEADAQLRAWVAPPEK